MADRGRVVRRVAGWIGLVLFLFPLYWFVASGLLAPLWAVVGLVTLWAVTLIWAIRIRSRRPWLVLALPFALMAIWVIVISIGEALLGWTA